jgi:mono/diheme cytochrome c family protein
MSTVRWSRLLVTAPLVAGAVLFGACGDDDDDDGGGGGGDADVAAVVAAVPTADVAAGESVFSSNCSSCHGDDGGGGIGPDLQEVADRLTVEQQADVVVNGRGTMPAWGGELSPDEIAQVIRYTREGL